MKNANGSAAKMRLKDIRLHRGWSQNKLASESSLSRQAIAQIESGEKSPTLNTLQKLADALGVTISELIGEADFPQQAAI